MSNGKAARARAGKAALRDVCLGLSRMLRAGVPLQDALLVLAGSCRGGLGAALRDLHRRVAAGDPLSEALGRYPRLFRPRHVLTMRAAERAGDLAQGFDSIGAGLEASLLLLRKLGRGLRYPAFLVLCSILLEPLPQLLSQKTSYLHAISRPLFHLALLCATVMLLWRLLSRMPFVGALLRRLAWSFPWPASLYVTHVRAVFCEVLGRNLKAGLAVPESLRLAAEVSCDPVAQDGLDGMIQGLAAGRDLGTMLGEQRLVHPGDLVVVVAGERAGSLGAALCEVTDRYRERLTLGLSSLIAALNIVLTVGLLAYSGYAIVQSYRSMSGEMEQMLKGLQGDLPMPDIKDLKELEGLF